MKDETDKSAATLGPLSVTAGDRNRESVADFDLIRFFAIACFGCLTLVGCLLAVMAYKKFSRSIIERDAMITMALTQAIIEHHGLGEELNDEAPAGNAAEFRKITGKVGILLTLVSQMPEVLRANIYSRENIIVWSTVQQLVGQQFEENEDLQKAFSGNLVSEISDRSEITKQEHIFFDKEVDEFVEHYFPIWNEDRIKIVAVAEIYKDPEALLHTIRAGMALISATAILAGALIFGILFWIIRRASRVMRSQQEQLVESQTLAVVGEMASIFAHGIRNPLTSIRTSAEVALEEQDGEAQSEAARDIVGQTDRIEKWVRELLQASPVERANLRQLDMVGLLRDCLEQFSHAMEKRGVRGVFDERGPVAQICGDRPLLEQGFNNLISNAMDAMPDGGDLTLRIGMAENGTSVLVDLVDTGTGIPKEHLGKIFKPFYTSKRSSSGLGLPLTKRIVERHDGEITVTSREGAGTTVSLRIPLEAGQCPPAY